MRNIIIDDADAGIHYLMITELFFEGEIIDCIPWRTTFWYDSLGMICTMAGAYWDISRMIVDERGFAELHMTWSY